MPAPTTTGSSKPEEVLEAQLDYVAHQLGGSILDDSRYALLEKCKRMAASGGLPPYPPFRL